MKEAMVVLHPLQVIGGRSDCHGEADNVPQKLDSKC